MRTHHAYQQKQIGANCAAIMNERLPRMGSPSSSRTTLPPAHMPLLTPTTCEWRRHHRGTYRIQLTLVVEFFQLLLQVRNTVVLFEILLLQFLCSFLSGIRCPSRHRNLGLNLCVVLFNLLERRSLLVNLLLHFLHLHWVYSSTIESQRLRHCRMRQYERNQGPLSH